MMRISTATIFDQGAARINEQTRQFQKVGDQLASGRRVVNPSDDPQAASRAVGLQQSIAISEQYADARVSTRNSLSQQGSVLATVGDNITRAKVLITQASNGTLSDLDRQSVASELRGVYESILGQANATDGNGRYLFAGYQDRSKPYVKDAAGSVNYVGDNNTQKVKVDDSRLMTNAENGAAVFNSVSTGAGYLAEQGAGNTGSLTFKGPDVLNANDPDFGNVFTINFVVDAAGPRYSVNGGPEVAFFEGSQIEFGGLGLTLEGSPADGDSFTVGKAVDMNTDLFRTLEKAVSALELNTDTDPNEATVKNTLKTVMRELSNSLDNVLTTQARIGSRLNELDSIDAVADNRLINYKSSMSDLVDLNYTDAISEYSRRQTGLQAAQKAFADMSKLSLFNYI